VKTARVFNRNFFDDFRAVLGEKHTIQRFELCDFEVRGGGRVGGSCVSGVHSRGNRGAWLAPPPALWM